MSASFGGDFDDDRGAVLRALGDAAPSSPIAPPHCFAPKDDLIRRFMRAADENGATAERLPRDDAIPSAAQKYLQARGLPPEVVCAGEWSRLPWRAAGIRAARRAPAESDVCGVTGVIAAAADCGAMSADGGEAHQLVASLLPPHHIAIVREAAVMPSLADILQTPRGVFALFCGPSRTADIEQTLTFGVHGPLSVHILLVANAS